MNIKETPEIRERINKLYAANNNSITPDLVYEDGKKTDSPLHDLFEWDTAAAARKHNLEVARAIIRCVHVDIRVNDVEYSGIAYVHDSRTPQVQGYRQITHVRTDKENALETLTREFQGVADGVRRCRELAIGLGLESEFDRLLRQIIAVREVIVVRAHKFERDRGRPQPPSGRRRTTRGR